MLTEFCTEVVAAPERFALWEDFATQSHMRNRMRSEDQADFRAKMRILNLGDSQVSALTCPHLEVTRTTKLIRQSDPEVLMINCMLGGGGRVDQARRGTTFGVGDIMLLDSSHAYHGQLHALPDIWRQLVVQVPRGLLPLPEQAVQRLLAVSVPARHGIGALSVRWLADLIARAGEFTPADIPTIASVTADLLGAWLGRHLEAKDVMTPEGRKRVLQVHIRAFISQHLGDPALTPENIAAAHGISIRHLYTLFHEQGHTVAGWIRERRLEHCRQDLADARLLSLPIQAIAARWGLPEPAHFSRAFRAAYGMPPSEYRRSALQVDSMQGSSTKLQKRSKTS